ncbi:MAG: Fur family transcriptional regulator [Pseudomonadota bacterium]
MADNAHIFGDHDHRDCSETAIAAVEAACAQRGARLTRIRRRVLELLWETHEPIGAYDLLARLKAEGFSAQPPVVYRALDFLIREGFAHKLQSLNAYTGCAHPTEGHPAYFLICGECGRAAELHDAGIQHALGAAAKTQGFKLSDAVVEIEGRCAECLSKAD